MRLIKDDGSYIRAPFQSKPTRPERVTAPNGAQPIEPKETGAGWLRRKPGTMARLLYLQRDMFVCVFLCKPYILKRERLMTAGP